MISADLLLDAEKDLSKKGKKFWKWAIAIFAVMSMAGFMSFICEEAMQAAMFSAFAYSNAKDWEGLNRHIGTLKTVHATSEFMIVAFGWLNPIMFPAYMNYLSSNKAFIKSQEALVKKNL